MNLLEEVSGTLPQDKQKMLDVIRRYQELSESERLIFKVGRLGGAYRSTNDLTRDPVTYQKIENLILDLKGKEGSQGVDRFITDMVERYI